VTGVPWPPLESLHFACPATTGARYTPDVAHWLPFREVEIIREGPRRLGEFELNRIVCVSADTSACPLF